MASIFNVSSEQKSPIAILLLSHGPLAQGLLDSAKMIYGESAMADVAAFSLNEGDDADTYMAKIVQAASAYKNRCVFLVDFLGGSPCNQLRIFAAKNKIPIHAVLGVNMPMLFAALDLRREGKTPEEIAKSIVEDAQAGILQL